jgi:YD repeat-containing protein
MMNSWWTPAGIGSIGVAPAEVKHQVFPDGTKARIKQIKASDGDQASFFDTGTYTYDAAGNITAIAGATGVTAGWSYTYDLLQRLASATSVGSRTYTYLDFGNLTSIGGTTIPVDIATNRLSNGTTNDYQYDNQGNLTNEPMTSTWTRRMRYDPMNRLVAAWSTE